MKTTVKPLSSLKKQSKLGYPGLKVIFRQAKVFLRSLRMTTANIVEVDLLRAKTDSKYLDELLNGPVKALQADQAIGMPTETVYGLAANCLRADATTRIFQVKNRPMDNPLIVHISSRDMLEQVVDPEFLNSMPDHVSKVMDRFWPGPLTLLLPAHVNVPECTTAGLKTVGVRFPSHPIAQALIERAGFPLAAPSANLSGRPSPTTAQHVFADLKDRIDWIVDGGASGLGLESTVVDLMRQPPVILRPGSITQAMLREVVPDIVVYKQKSWAKADSEEANAVANIDESRPPTPGMKYKHYSPNAPVWLFKGEDVNIQEYLATHAQGKRIIRLTIQEEQERCFDASVFASYSEIPLSHTGNLLEIAQNLFAGLREADEQAPDVIVAECVEDNDEGLAIMNRLTKSAGEIIINLDEHQ